MLRFLILISMVSGASSALAQSPATPLETQEIQLPSYILADDGMAISETTSSELEASFEDELAALLAAEKEMLPRYKFKASVLVLNKNTNDKHVYTLENGTTVIAGPLAIKAENCLHDYHNINHNDYIFLDITNNDNQTGKSNTGVIYHNWMSHRLPGVTPFSHTTYSVKALSCQTFGELEPQPEEPTIEQTTDGVMEETAEEATEEMAEDTESSTPEEESSPSEELEAITQ